MDQLNSMFTRMKRGIWTGAEGSQTTEKQQRSHDSQSHFTSSEESDEDGFLVIDPSKPEAEMFTAVTLDRGVRHPASATHQGSLPGVYGADQGLVMFATCTSAPVSPAPVEAEPLFGTHPALHGVPFSLHPSLQASDRLNAALGHLDLVTTRFDWTKYDYDFELDRSSLRDLCHLEDGGRKSCSAALSLWES